MPKRSYRKRQTSEEEENGDDDLKYYKPIGNNMNYFIFSAILEETKEIQKFRKRPKGVR